MRRLAAPLSLLVLASGLRPLAGRRADRVGRRPVLPRLRDAIDSRARRRRRSSLLPCAFSPTVTQVDVGETVTFTNGTDFTHLVTGANQAWGSRDVELLPGETVELHGSTRPARIRMPVRCIAGCPA